jgi:uncharacterized protein YraI
MGYKIVYNRKKRLIIIIALIILLTVFISAAQDTIRGTVPVELNVRSGPGTDNGRIGRLQPGTTIIIEGRNDDGDWIVIQTIDGSIHGWVAANYVDFDKNVIDSLPLSATMFAVPASPVKYANTPVGDMISGISNRSRQIFLHGQSLGNHPNVFSKVGDSLTDTPYMFETIGWGHYNLYEFDYLQPVISYFAEANARDGNSFVNRSFAARAAWTTVEVLNPDMTDPAICLPDETPLACEYRVVKPSVALILIGTNDMALTPIGQYQINLQRIVNISIEMGVIPVLSTIPDRLDEDVSAYNRIIRRTARNYAVPLWDLWGELQTLPNRGRGDDNIHLSFPPGNFDMATDFRVEHLQYGYVVRNLSALQVLDAIWRQALVGE